MTVMRIRFSLGCAALLLALSLPVRGADLVWIQLNSRNFILYTDTTEIKGRRLLEDFEGRLAAMGTALGGIPQRQFPVEVFLFSNREEFLEAAPRPTGPDAPGEFAKSAYLWRGPIAYSWERATGLPRIFPTMSGMRSATFSWSAL